MDSLTDFQTGLMLLVVGMVTVFLILLLVIYTGKLMISLVNKFAPEEEVASKQSVAAAVDVIPENVKKVVAATVKELTSGSGKVSSITRL